MSLTGIILCAVIGLTSGSGVLPEDFVAAAEGGSVTFTTLLTTETQLNFISWAFGARDIITFTGGSSFPDPEYEDRITLNFLTGSLELRNLALSDIGEYAVRIIPAAGDAPINGLIRLIILVPVSNVTITATSTDLVEFNDTVTLSCSASGSSSSFLWFKDGVEVTANDRIQITDGGATLTIVTVWRVDEGLYTCNVSNPFSSSTSDEEIFVNYGPEDVIFKILPSGYYYGEGSFVSLSCSADSRPDAQFKWFINEEILTSTGAQINLVMEHSGNYSCQAFNNKTLRYNTSQPAEKIVLKNITNGSVKPSNPPVEGGSVNLTCDASGSRPTRKWIINAIELKPSENIVFYEEKRVVHFRVLNRKDTARYTCIIFNFISSQNIEYTMNVNYGPDSVTASGPGSVQEGATLKLSCSARSVPTAIFSWIKNETALAQSQEYIKENIGFSDSGEYICRATNDITNRSLEASHTVHVTEAPSFSTGAIVGITIASLVVVAGAAAGAFYFFKNKSEHGARLREYFK